MCSDFSFSSKTKTKERNTTRKKRKYQEGYVGCRHAQGTRKIKQMRVLVRACLKKAQHKDGHSLGRAQCVFGIAPIASACDALPGSQLPCIFTRRHNIPSTAPYSVSGSPGFPIAAYLRGSLGWSNQRGTKTYQVCCGHPRYDLNLIRLFLPFSDTYGIFPVPPRRGHKPID